MKKRLLLLFLMSPLLLTSCNGSSSDPSIVVSLFDNNGGVFKKITDISSKKQTIEEIYVTYEEKNAIDIPLKFLKKEQINENKTIEWNAVNTTFSYLDIVKNQLFSIYNRNYYGYVFDMFFNEAIPNLADKAGQKLFKKLNNVVEFNENVSRETTINKSEDYGIYAEFIYAICGLYNVKVTYSKQELYSPNNYSDWSYTNIETKDFVFNAYIAKSTSSTRTEILKFDAESALQEYIQNTHLS